MKEFDDPALVLEYARNNLIALAVLDIEILDKKKSDLDGALKRLYPHIVLIYINSAGYQVLEGMRIRGDYSVMVSFNRADVLNMARKVRRQEEREKIQSFTGTAGDSSLKLYTSKATALYGAMGQLAEAAMAGTDYTAAFDAAADALNGMVDQYNRVI